MWRKIGDRIYVMCGIWKRGTAINRLSKARWMSIRWPRLSVVLSIALKGRVSRNCDSVLKSCRLCMPLFLVPRCRSNRVIWYMAVVMGVFVLSFAFFFFFFSFMTKVNFWLPEMTSVFLIVWLSWTKHQKIRMTTGLTPYFRHVRSACQPENSKNPKWRIGVHKTPVSL